MSRLGVVVVLAGVVCVAGGCATRGTQRGAAGCQPSGPPDLASAPVTDGLAGDYRLTLVATQGAHHGRIEGTLTLVPMPDSLRALGTSQVPLVGTTQLPLEEVGALRLGDVTSRDPLRPGAAVIERGTGPGRTIVVRLGSEANRRDLQRFEGGYTVLRIHRITEDGFSGLWVSGVMEDEAGGHFCAVRQDG